jgi:GNAT superfamily N-acetyltransferase
VSEIVIRQGGPDDFPAILQMFDDAVAWLAARGSAGQWGAEPWTGIPRRIEQVRDMAGRAGLRVAEIDGEPAGVCTLQETCSPHVPTAAEPEVYLGWLLTSRRFTGLGVGARLIARVLVEARQRGIALVRLDCWAGGDGDLARYYEGQGFTPTVRFDVDGWIGQVFELRLD